MDYFKKWPKKVKDQRPTDWSQVSDQALHEELETAETFLREDGGECQETVKAMRREMAKRVHLKLIRQTELF